MSPVQRKATGALLVVCLIWGSTFLLMEVGTDALHAAWGRDALANGAAFLAVRFILAAAAMPLVVRGFMQGVNREAWKHGIALSVVLSAAFLLQIFGLGQADVHPSQSAYLTSLYVVATPILGAILHRRFPSRAVLIAVPLSLTGAAFIAGPPRGGLSIGAWSTIACAVLFGLQILMTDHASRRVEPRALTFTMLVPSAVWMTLAFLIAPGGLQRLRSASLWAPLRSPAFVLSELFCAILATVVVMLLMNRWQRELAPTRAAIIYTTEPIFAAILSIVAGRDTLTGWLVFGSTMILAANLAAELPGIRKAPAPATRS